MIDRFNLLVLCICYKTIQTVRRFANAKVTSLAVFADDDLGLRMICFGEFESEILSFLRERFELSTKSTQMIDVGANVGNHIHGLSKYFDFFHAFEPDPRNFQLLKANMALRNNVCCHETALSDKQGRAVLLTDNRNSGKSQIIKKNSQTAQTQNKNAIIVKTERLDNVISDESKVGFIKIDVEGHELQVLKGASRILKQQKPLILLEVLAQQIDGGHSPALDFLKEFGYTNFQSLELETFQILRIDNLSHLRWINHIIYLLQLIIIGRQKLKPQTLDISNLKKKNYNSVLVSD